MRTLGALLGFALALAACDSVSAPPPPRVCGTVAERSDTLFVAVGDSATLDLTSLFAGVSAEPLAFALAEAAPGVRVNGDRAIVLPATEGVMVFALRAVSACGIVAEGVVTVSALPSGASCPAPDAAPFSTLTVPTGGARFVRRLWGADGLISGLFHRDSPAVVEGGGGLVQVNLTWASGERVLQIIPGGETGIAAITVRATDACLRPVTVDVPIEVALAPHCVLIEAGFADFFPLEVGRTWTFRYERGFQPGLGGGTSWMETGDETWEVTATTPCNEGYREYTMIVTRMPDSGPPVVGTIVWGSSNGVVAPPAYTGNVGWWLPAIPRLNPSEPAQLTFTSGGGGSNTSATVERDVGIMSTDASVRGGAYSREYYERALSGY